MMPRISRQLDRRFSQPLHIRKYPWRPAVPNPEIPICAVLSQNFPNPFNATTTIKFELPKSSQVTLSVHDILGREVSMLINQRMDAGFHEVKFDGSNLASGVYFYRLQSDSFVETKKLLLMK